MIYYIKNNNTLSGLEVRIQSSSQMIEIFILRLF